MGRVADHHAHRLARLGAGRLDQLDHGRLVIDTEPAVGGFTGLRTAGDVGQVGHDVEAETVEPRGGQRDLDRALRVVVDRDPLPRDAGIARAPQLDPHRPGVALLGLELIVPGKAARLHELERLATVFGRRLPGWQHGRRRSGEGGARGGPGERGRCAHGPRGRARIPRPRRLDGPGRFCRPRCGRLGRPSPRRRRGGRGCEHGTGRLGNTKRRLRSGRHGGSDVGGGLPRGQGRGPELTGERRLIDLRIGRLERELPHGVVARRVGDRDLHRERFDLLARPPDLLADKMGRRLSREHAFGRDLLPALVTLATIFDGQRVEPQRIVDRGVATDDLPIGTLPDAGGDLRAGGIDEHADVGAGAAATATFRVDRPKLKPIFSVGLGAVRERPGVRGRLGGLRPGDAQV